MMKKIEPKEDEMMVAHSEGMKKDKAPKMYPHLRLDHQFFPEAKKWEVGKEYDVTLRVKMTGISISKFQNDSEFDIVGCEMHGESKGKMDKMDEKKDEKKDEKMDM